MGAISALALLGLPERWRGRDRFVMLDSHLGGGNACLSAWAAWLADPLRCKQLHLIVIVPGLPPPSAGAWRSSVVAAHADTPHAALAQRLADALPPPTHNLHRLAFEDGRVQVLLARGDVAFWLTELVAQVDAYWLHAASDADPDRQWDTRQIKALARLAAPGATLATATADATLGHSLHTAGFKLAPSNQGLRAYYEPTFTPRRAPQRAQTTRVTEHQALIIGAGLAGCACAHALAEQGWRSTVIDRHATPAQEASGNAAGLFHGIVNPQDGAHARFNRAAALEVQRAVQRVLQVSGAHTLKGSLNGLLRLETEASLATMQQTLLRLNLPADYVQALSAEQTSELCGLRISAAAWFYPGGGWVDPAGLARAYLAQAGECASWLGSVQVAALRRIADGWRLLDGDGSTIAEAPVVVLANACDANVLLAGLGQPAWPLQRVRGQISLLPSPACHSLTLPSLPIAGAGYLLPDVGDVGQVSGIAVFGATSQADDEDATVRHGDHLHNLSQLARLTGRSLDLQPADLQGRTAWRCVTEDRLPLIGAAPDAIAARQSARLDQPRFVPRLPGLFVLAGLGSRGITWSALGAQVLASCVTGAPVPLEAGLLDAVDPARFISRAARRPATRPARP